MSRSTRPAPSSKVIADLHDAKSFIEDQFPVAKISQESFKERKAVQSQTLTGLGKWWGRKPLILVRAALLGLLMPASDDPLKDREVFLQLLTMDDEGMGRRRSKKIPNPRLVEELLRMPGSVQKRFLKEDGQTIKKLDREGAQKLQVLVFDRMPFSEKREYASRPEQIDGPSDQTWSNINAHLGTAASSLPELVEELGQRRFGSRPKVGDAFCGAGSIPFEAARLGCDAYGSDLSPVGTILTWASLNLVGGSEETAQKIREAQEKILHAVDEKVVEWGIETNEVGWRADAFLYCVEVKDPESGYHVPLLPSLLIGPSSGVVGHLVPDHGEKRFKVEIQWDATSQEQKTAKGIGTISSSRLVPPDGGPSTPIEVIRRGMRMWENEDIAPRPDDVFQERLYCIRWIETYSGEKGEERTRRHYRAPTAEDMAREAKVLKLLKERFPEWQKKGFIPNRRIEPGSKTDEPIRTRGWTYWHHLFTPRQLLLHGLLTEMTEEIGDTIEEKVAGLLGVGRCCNWNSRLMGWGVGAARESFAQTFYNQALNTLYNYGSKGLGLLEGVWYMRYDPQEIDSDSVVIPLDARQLEHKSHFWITDPPYADAINYEEITEFFLAWYGGRLPVLFPDWYADSKRALVVKGNDQGFRQAMVECYEKMVHHMPDNGMQIVMFTHQDARVWADLALILWAAGLRVTAAWCISTETDAVIKEGNYVQGTVLLVCRKRTEEEPVFLDEIAYKIEAEVREQLDSMTALEDDSDPNFADADYQLAAYAAALRILTERPIEEVDPAREIQRERSRGEVNPVEQMIVNAVKVACDHLVPKGIDREVWKTLSPMERFYLKGLEVEGHGELRSGVYQELARGFGAADYSALLASTKANQTRLKTATELGRRGLSGDGFAGSLLRQILFAIHSVGKNNEVKSGLDWFHTELPDYWNSREKIIHLLENLASTGGVRGLDHWTEDARSAALLAGAVRNDHV
ncbi:MAG: DUF1156 domain-containing protein [bacterium]|nr:DUF1156 domain-containing protein [bacterium]